MGHPISGVRKSTGAWPDGIETQNADEVYATGDSDTPAALTLATWAI